MRLEAKRCTMARFTAKHYLVRLGADLSGGVALASAQHDKLLERSRYARRAVRSVHCPLRSVEPPCQSLRYILNITPWTRLGIASPYSWASSALCSPWLPSSLTASTTPRW